MLKESTTKAMMYARQGTGQVGGIKVLFQEMHHRRLSRKSTVLECREIYVHECTRMPRGLRTTRARIGGEFKRLVKAPATLRGCIYNIGPSRCDWHTTGIEPM